MTTINVLDNKISAVQVKVFGTVAFHSKVSVSKWRGGLRTWRFCPSMEVFRLENGVRGNGITFYRGKIVFLPLT